MGGKVYSKSEHVALIFYMKIYDNRVLFTILNENSCFTTVPSVNSVSN